MKLKQFWLLLLASCILVFALAMIGMLGHDYKFSVSCIGYFIISWALFNKFPEAKTKVAIIVSLPLLSLYVPIHLLSFQDSRLSLPSSCSGFIGIGLGFLAWQFKRARIVFILSALGLALTVQLYLYTRWLDYLNYGQFSTAMNQPAPQLKFVNELGTVKGNEIFEDKIVVLDFWNTACGVCFQKFPTLQKMSDQYSNSNVEVYAINVSLERDSVNQSYQALKKYSYTFKNLNAVEQSITKEMNVFAYPTTFIIVDGVIKFKGDLDDVDAQLEKLVKSNATARTL